ncbi:MAG: hypothetical protein L6M37_00915 [Candidatus Methylarchaceae archaeon HK02M1]|nr:hypothetical protein [Candidatus Methylarchaceae archaeon HK02M1]
MERIDEYIKDLEAIKYHDQVKKERDDALSRIDELLDTNSNLETKVKKLSKKNEDLVANVSDLEKAVEVKDKEIDKLKHISKGLENRVEELEKLKVVSEGKTLREAEKAFLKAFDKEVKIRGDKTFKSMKDKWERSEKPKEVRNDAIKWLNQVIENRGKPGRRLVLKQLKDVGLPEKVEEVISSEINRGLNAEFMRRVEDESSRKAFEMLDQMASNEWPIWFRENVEPKIKELENSFITYALSRLAGPWTIICDRCGSKRSVEFAADEIQMILKHRHAIVECVNPNCTNFIGRHRIRIELKELISNYITSGYAP